jgi:glycosyltransferase involved in cell wall biosynthesis
MTRTPPISIVIRTFNSARTIDEVLSRLTLGADDEIIIVDSGSCDATLEIAGKHHARIIESDPPFNYSRTLNEGFLIARNPWVLVISSHCIPVQSGLLERLREVAAAAGPALAVAYGLTCLREPARISQEVELGGMDDWNAGRLRNGGNGLALYRRSLWEQHPFDESLITAEDLVWFLWALEGGHSAALVHGALCFYRNQGSLCHMFRKGWFENQIAAKMLKARLPPENFARNMRMLSLNVGHLGKLFLRREIPLRTFIAQLAHACGAFLEAMCRLLKFSDTTP